MYKDGVRCGAINGYKVELASSKYQQNSSCFLLVLHGVSQENNTCNADVASESGVGETRATAEVLKINKVVPLWSVSE